MKSLEEYLASRRTRIEETLDDLLPLARGPARTVAEAMRYAVQGGGKRLRSILTLATCEACGGTARVALEAACALELIHTYSLIHDDLPAMDDDDLRRGRPTVHRAFGEGVAVLAGDALQTLAFEILATRPPGPGAAARRLESVATLARCAGVGGLVGGQMADLEAALAPCDGEQLDWIHRHKTGALFAASVEIGAIHAGADSARRSALVRYGRCLGLAFQITDDVLDCTADAATLGKTPGKDAQAGKATYPALFGVEDSNSRAAQRVEEAIAALRAADLRPGPLDALAYHAVARTR